MSKDHGTRTGNDTESGRASNQPSTFYYPLWFLALYGVLALCTAAWPAVLPVLLFPHHAAALGMFEEAGGLFPDHESFMRSIILFQRVVIVSVSAPVLAVWAYALWTAALRGVTVDENRIRIDRGWGCRDVLWPDIEWAAFDIVPLRIVFGWLLPFAATVIRVRRAGTFSARTIVLYSPLERYAELRRLLSGKVPERKTVLHL